jgi:hypothetical protein
VKNRFQSLPFKCNLQRYAAVRLGAKRLVMHNGGVKMGVAVAAAVAARRDPPGAR